jgi:DNA-binding FadR family transcriptional regulator
LNFTERKGDGAVDFDGYTEIMAFREAIEFAAINLAVVNATDEELNSLMDIAKRR